MLIFTGVPHCPAGMHPYHTRCDKDTVSQKSCDTPEPVNIGKGLTVAVFPRRNSFTRKSPTTKSVLLYIFTYIFVYQYRETLLVYNSIQPNIYYANPCFQASLADGPDVIVTTILLCMMMALAAPTRNVSHDLGWDCAVYVQGIGIMVHLNTLDEFTGLTLKTL